MNKFEFVYTPKDGNWIDITSIELNALIRLDSAGIEGSITLKILGGKQRHGNCSEIMKLLAASERGIKVDLHLLITWGNM